MKMFVKLATTLALSVAIVACGGDKKDGAADEAAADKAAKTEPAKAAEPEKPVELTAALDVGAAVKDADDTRYAGVKMTGPEGAKVVDSGMGLTVEWGEISMELRYEFDDEGAVAKGKDAASKDELNKLVKFHVDTPEAVLWEAKSALASDGDPNNHLFVATVKVGDKNLVCKNEGYGQFSKVQAEALMKTCQSAKK